MRRVPYRRTAEIATLRDEPLNFGFYCSIHDEIRFRTMRIRLFFLSSEVIKVIS